MQPGRVLGDGYALKWLDKSKKLVLGMFTADAEPVGESGGLGRPYLHGFRCTACKKMILDC